MGWLLPSTCFAALCIVKYMFLLFCVQCSVFLMVFWLLPSSWLFLFRIAKYMFLLFRVFWLRLLLSKTRFIVLCFDCVGYCKIHVLVILCSWLCWSLTNNCSYHSVLFLVAFIIVKYVHIFVVHDCVCYCKEQCRPAESLTLS